MSSKSTFSNSTSKSYALALFELAKESSEIDKAADGMDTLRNLINQSSDFKQMILNPVIKKEEKNNVILNITSKYNFCKTLEKFLSFLTHKNRLFFLSHIIDNFLNLVSKNKGELKAKLLSSKELSKTELEKIQIDLANDFKSAIKVDYKYDPDLIAGLVIQIESVMIDTSIKSKLKNLEKNMVEA